MIRAFLASAIAFVLCVPALAEDARLATRQYNSREVVRIEGRAGVQATIAFAEDEHIENVAIGDSNLWQVTPNKRANLLFLKPLAPSARTNMTVVTDRRRYFFDLAASPAAHPVYLLSFAYPDEPKTRNQAQTAGSEALTAEEARAVLEKPVDPAELNFAWTRKGSAKLLPARVYDDGQSTYLAWAAGNPVPAILIRNEKGAEGPVNFAVRDDVIVIDGVPDLILLRSGKDAASLENRGAPRIPAATPALAVAGPGATIAKDR